jgi:hypothetical protein
VLYGGLEWEFVFDVEDAETARALLAQSTTVIAAGFSVLFYFKSFDARCRYN